MTRRRRIWLALTTILGTFALYEIATTFIAYTADAYVQSDVVAVAPQVTGRIITVHANDNQSVAQGDLLATIDPAPFQFLVDQLQAEVDEAEAQVAVDQNMIASAQAGFAAASAAAAYARETRARVTALIATQDVARADLDKAEDATRQANASLEIAQQGIARAQSTAMMHHAAHARSVAALATAQWQLARTRLLAPTRGTITNLTIRAGDTARADVPLIGIVDASAWRIVANYKQSFIRGFTPGDLAWVWLDSQPWHLHKAKVVGIARGINRDPAQSGLLAYVAPTTDWIRLQRRFPVTLALVDPPADLTLYMGADARVLILP
jgi:multidrug efflux system membrane fusion protein